MFNMVLTIGTFENVKKLVNIAMQFAEDIDIQVGRYCIDAKSIMGVFSLDISKPVTLCVHTDDATVTTTFINKLHEAEII